MNRWDVSCRIRFAQTALLVCALGASGCLRFGYAERDKLPDKPGDAGIDSGSGGAGQPSPAGMGGRGGSGGTGGSSRAGAGGHAGEADDDGGAQPVDGGAAGRDAAPDDSDAGAADGGMPVELCPERPELLFCDGFEDPTFSRWSYDVPSNGVAVRTTDFWRTGSAALHATTGISGNGGQARWATEALANKKSGDIWFRFYNFLPTTVTVNTNFSIGVMSEITMPWAGFSLHVYPTSVEINSQSGKFPGMQAFPRGQWVCVELHVKIDPAVGLYEAYLDGKLAVQSTPVNTLPRDGFTAAEIGIHYADANQGPVEVYVDDVALGTARVPCE